jgi:hypothetical protein
MKRQNMNNAALDRELGAALAKFTTAEPRAGLEERILANLRIEQKRAAERAWWRWPAVVALAAAIVISVFMASRSRTPTQNIAAHNPPATMQPSTHNGMQGANDSEHGSTLPHELSAQRLKPRAFSSPATVPVRSPKLDEFPSPQPLSEQEKMLAEYVAEHHQQAVLIARVRMAELKEDWVEEMKEASATSNRAPSDSPETQQENR